MKLKDIKLLKQKPVSELKSLLGEAVRELKNLKLEQSAGKLAATHKLRDTKYKIALISTLCNN